MIVVITGGRLFGDRKFVWDNMDFHAVVLGITAVVNGRAKTGVDQFVHEWCEARGVEERSYPADWDAYGDAAGVLRNQQMLDEEPGIEHALIFPGGTGTMDMARRCRKAGIERTFINEEEDPIKELLKWG